MAFQKGKRAVMPKAETAAEIEDDPHRLARPDDGDMDAKYVHRDRQAGLGEGLHFLGGISIDLAGNRAISAQVRRQIGVDPGTTSGICEAITIGEPIGVMPGWLREPTSSR